MQDKCELVEEMLFRAELGLQEPIALMVPERGRGMMQYRALDRQLKGLLL